MKIVVPSLGRAGTSHSATWLNSLEFTKRYNVEFAVHHDEVKAYRTAYPWASTSVLPDSVRRHAGLVRKTIIEREREPFFFVDDDIGLRLINFRDPAAMFDQLQRHMQKGKVPMAGIGKQIFSNGVIPHCEKMNGDPVAIRNKFCSTVYGVDPAAFRDCELERLPVYEDCALIIHAIRAGGCIVSYSATHTNKTPPAGGCNSWRTPAIIKRSMRELAAMYPEIVRVIPTKHTSHNQDLGIGVRVAWSKIATAPISTKSGARTGGRAR